jgi:hypothetical protein
MERVESQKAGFPLFPHPLEIPAGFPHYHGYGGDYHVSEDRQSPPKTCNQSHSHRKGLVNHVPGLKRKGCPGTFRWTYLIDYGSTLHVVSGPGGNGGLMELSVGAKPKPIMSRLESNVDLSGESLPAQVAAEKSFSVEWTGFLMPAETGDYLIGIRAAGFATVTIDGRNLAHASGTHGGGTKLGRIHLEKGVKVALDVRYGDMGRGEPAAQLIWAPVNNVPSPEAVAVASNADLVIAVVGITSQPEGEEMPVSEPGFLGGDRTSIDLPEPEEALVEAVAATGKPLVVALMNRSALAVNWINQHANAILEAWYSAEEGGAAIADTLSGRNNPSGRLPVTFCRDVSQLPNFEDYSWRIALTGISQVNLSIPLVTA